MSERAKEKAKDLRERAKSYRVYADLGPDERPAERGYSDYMEEADALDEVAAVLETEAEILSRPLRSRVEVAEELIIAAEIRIASALEVLEQMRELLDPEGGES